MAETAGAWTRRPVKTGCERLVYVCHVVQLVGLYACPVFSKASFEVFHVFLKISLLSRTQSVRTLSAGLLLFLKFSSLSEPPIALLLGVQVPCGLVGPLSQNFLFDAFPTSPGLKFRRTDPYWIM